MEDLRRFEKYSKGIRLSARQVYIGQRDYKGCLAGKIKESFNKVINSRLLVIGRRVYYNLSGIRGLSIKGYGY